MPVISGSFMSGDTRSMQADLILTSAAVPNRDSFTAPTLQVVPQRTLVGPWRPLMGYPNSQT